MSPCNRAQQTSASGASARQFTVPRSEVSQAVFDNTNSVTVVVVTVVVTVVEIGIDVVVDAPTDVVGRVVSVMVVVVVVSSGAIPPWSSQS